MELITILNHCHRPRGFVYQHARFGPDKKSIEVDLRPGEGSAAVCSGCHQPASGYGHLPRGSAVAPRTECKALWALRPSPRSPCCAMQPTRQRHDGKPYSSLRRLPPQVHEAWKQKPINLEDLRQAEPEPELRRVKRRKGPLALVNSENLPVKTYVYELSSEERVCPGCVVERKEVGSMSARSMRAPIVSGREKIRRSTKGRGLVESLICYHFDMGTSEILCCLPGFTVSFARQRQLGSSKRPSLGFGPPSATTSRRSRGKRYIIQVSPLNLRGFLLSCLGRLS